MDQPTKAQIVLEGLSGQIDIAKLCAKYQVSQTQYYNGESLLKRDPSFRSQKCYQERTTPDPRNPSTTRIIGDLTIELKKTEIELNS
jgi:transposase-like protein